MLIIIIVCFRVIVGGEMGDVLYLGSILKKKKKKKIIKKIKKGLFLDSPINQSQSQTLSQL